MLGCELALAVCGCRSTLRRFIHGSMLRPIHSARACEEQPRAICGLCKLGNTPRAINDYARHLSVQKRGDGACCGVDDCIETASRKGEIAHIAGDK